MFSNLLTVRSPVGSKLVALFSVPKAETKLNDNIQRLFVKHSHQLAREYFDNFSNYCQMIAEAKETARRSIIVDHCGLDHIDLKSGFNNIEQVYSVQKETKRGSTRLSVIEFKSEDDANMVVNEARHKEGQLPVPLKILSCLASLGTTDIRDLPFKMEHAKLSYKRETSASFTSYTDFITNNMMSLVDLKMRFITLVNFESVLCSGCYSMYEIMPFGSSVIDLGSDSGDLDLVVTRKENHQKLIEKLLSGSINPVSISKRPPSKLVHLDKSLYKDSQDRVGNIGPMRWFDYVLREYMPLTDNGVLFLPNAKVPIIKFTSRITSLDCDLSFNFGFDYRNHDIFSTNYSGIIMSQLLYSLCRNNNLFVAVAKYLKTFAKLTSVTSKGSQNGLTNFQFLSILIFYMQQITITASGETGKLTIDFRKPKQQPIVPSFKRLLNDTKSATERLVSLQLSEDQLNQLIPQVIIGFFKFYSNFNFIGDALNIYESRLERKLDNSTIYVLNPMDRSMNICRNVTKRGLDQFVQQVRIASQKLNQGNENPLSYMKSLLKEYHLQAKRMPREESHYDLRGGRLVSTTEHIAQDIFIDDLCQSNQIGKNHK